jgi:hypothetical protein
VTGLYLHDWAVLEHAGQLRRSAEAHHPVTTHSNKRVSLIARIALSLVAVAAVAGVVGLGSSTLAVQPAAAGHVAVPSPTRPAAIPGHRGLPIHRLPVVPNVDR